MKKSLFLLAAAMLCGMLFTACDKDEDHGLEGPISDKSLAGWFSSINHITEAEGSYDGVPYQDLNPYESYLGIGKMSDTEISLYCQIQWGETLLILSMPVIPLSGERFNVTFDHVSSDAAVTLNQTEYPKVRASAKGWLKDIRFAESRMSPVMPEITCDIAIECEIDGKKLILNISKVNQRPI